MVLSTNQNDIEMRGLILPFYTNELSVWRKVSKSEWSVLPGYLHYEINSSGKPIKVVNGHLNIFD